jgi:hypothetical protein
MFQVFNVWHILYWHDIGISFYEILFTVLRSIQTVSVKTHIIYIYLNLSSLPVAGRTGRKMSEATRWEAFRSLDKNRDGALTADELEAEIFVPRRLDNLDPDPDGGVGG